MSTHPKDESPIPPVPPRRGGRPRDPQVHAAILDAARQLADEVGYAALTIEGVARRAGVAKSTIYRRWDSKGLLVCEAVFGVQPAALSPTGRLVDDLGQLAENDRQLLHEGRNVLPGILADFSLDENLRAQIRERVLDPDLLRYRGVLQDSVHAQHIRGDLPLDLLRDVITGSMFYRTVIHGDPVDDGYVQRLVSLIVEGVRPA